jgi:2-succinyl-5-enolpyruvyl-6-hydroxy-3-cyclohexene-1-carboxylate synthase
MNPSTAFATVLVDELVRCGLREAVIAPGSRSAPLAMALHRRSLASPDTGGGPSIRLHVRIDERSASFLALGLAKASGRPVAVVCTSGTAAAHFHAAVIEADEAGVPLLVLTADRPPELRGTGANQTIDQIKLYGSAVRWFCEAGVPEDEPGQAGYWRSLADRAWSLAAGTSGSYAGPVHVNVPFREPLVPDVAVDRLEGSRWSAALGGRPAGEPWTQLAAPAAPTPPELELDWTERGLVLAGDGTADPAALVRLAADAGWPLLAEPSSGARRGATALTCYQYLLDSPGFLAAQPPEVIVSAGRPGLSRGQLSLLRVAGAGGRHVVLLQGPGRWSDPARSATDVAGRVVLRGGPRRPAETGWMQRWLAADAVVRDAADRALAAAEWLSEPLLARDLAAALPAGALLWAASSMPVRDLDRHMVPRSDVRVLASRGASGIDGLVSTALGAALAHQADGGGPAVALLGDLALVHDAPGLVLGPAEPRPDLCVVVVNNDGGGIFSTLEQAAFRESFDRVFGTPHGADVGALAAAAGLPYRRLERAADLKSALAGSGLRVVEVRTDRSDSAKLRAAISGACAAALDVVSC